MAIELTVWIVVPEGMPVPVTIWPATRCLVLVIPVTDADPFVSVPVKLTGWMNQGGGAVVAGGKTVL
jgi:hypothetical protein